MSVKRCNGILVQESILAPIAGFGTVELAAAVCAGGGGFGSISRAIQGPEAAAKAIHALQAMTDQPINVNFFCHRQPSDDCSLLRTRSVGSHARLFSAL
jgi:nitronate monooxygenase